MPVKQTHLRLEYKLLGGLLRPLANKKLMVST